ncbi:hypothetical protein FHS43_002857 [Streptosporangium becharense]|uniref:Uncharacterized protein n=1 Tax=Streptosporangium becharense TaxID=1816182 RepID=A0A7W9MJH9_9ACTN|nr:DUF5691 domain-containing protein [Streptosporangium becharense]MBB2911584.1 hypothetical protein [Streptosporangium becharense]MBB5822598.1 hypothetical protein [Streptosporangium becharense]
MNAAEWEELVSVALVGTDRRPLAGRAGSETEVLARAAVRTLRVRAGRRPVPAGEPPAAAAAEKQPVVPRAAADRLARILGGENPRLLDEWLRAAAERGYRLTPHLLPELLDRAAKDRSIRPQAGVLAGERGRWLARLNPAWEFLLAEATVATVTGLGDGGETWQLGTPGDRRAYLAALRAADPAGARELLAATWEKETPDDREAFLKVLADGLCGDDEPFLEAALDDRRREVRNEAAYLLSRLPESRLGLRMAERAARCLTVADGEIHVDPPASCDAAMERDGIRVKPQYGAGERSWWLQQVVARTPLAVWPRLFGRPPGEIVRMPMADWGKEIVAGWVRAAMVQEDPEWARELFLVDAQANLLAVLPREEQESVAVEFVRRNSGRNARHPHLADHLSGVAAPWGADLSRVVLETILDQCTGQPTWHTTNLINVAGERIDPALCDMAERFSPEPHIQEIAALLRFRNNMVKELQ